MSDRLRARIGAVLLILAGLVFALRLATASHDRAWSAGAAPRSSYALVVGTTYRLSTAAGPNPGVAPPLACTIVPIGPDGATGTPMPLAATALTGDRLTHDVASFVAPFTGSARIECPAGTTVFVDGAEDIGLDVSALLMVIGIALATAGLLLGASAVRAGRPETPAQPGPVTDGRVEGTRIEAAPDVG